MRSLLLAAGLGTRLKPLTDNMPKCLAPINGRPLLGYWLKALLREKEDRVLINLHHFENQVRDFVAATSYNEQVEFIYEEELLGTGGTLIQNREFMGNETFLLAHADNLTVFDMESFLSCHDARPLGTVMTMMTFRTDIPQSCGIVELDDKNVVSAFYEKVPNPPGNLANAAVYLMEPVVFSEIINKQQAQIDLSIDLIPKFIGRINSYENKIYHRDIGTVESLEKANSDFIHIHKFFNFKSE